MLNDKITWHMYLNKEETNRNNYHLILAVVLT